VQVLLGEGERFAGSDEPAVAKVEKKLA